MSLTTFRFFVLMDLLLFFAVQNHGCTGGKVFDENGLPLIGAKAVCEDLPAIGPVYSDGTGMYKWPDGAVPEGPHSFTLSMTGHESVTVRVDVKYTVAPGHTAAEGLVFQIPDIKLRKGSSVARSVGSSTKPPPRTLPSDRIPETAEAPGKDPFPGAPDKASVVTTTRPAVQPPTFPTLPPVVVTTTPTTLALIRPPTVVVTTTIVPTALTFPPPPTIVLPTTTLARTKATVPRTVPAPTVTRPVSSVSTTSKVASTVPPTVPVQGVGIAPPGQQWYQSPDQKYSFSAPMSWKVGFQGGRAAIQYEHNGCTPIQVLVQMNDSGRPQGKVIRETATVFSGINVQQQTFDNGTEGFFFSCAGDRYSVFKMRPETCEGADLGAAEQEAMLIITSLQCRQ